MSNKFFLRLVRKFVRKLSQKQDLFDVLPPYEYVQRVNEESVHTYLGIDRRTVKNWVIVGGYLGGEIPNILKNYPECTVSIFECSRRYVQRLQEKFSNNERVKIFDKAVSDVEGYVTFFETNLSGSGSLLEVGELSMDSYGMEPAEQFEVGCTTLDKMFGDNLIDVLQIDVQGAEEKVLKGARTTLNNTRAVFIEVSIKENLYQDAITFEEVSNIMYGAGFNLCLLGTDFNLTGNALYIQK